MAENKISFLLYCDYIGVFEQLSDREAGLLIKHILRYVNDKNPETDSRIIAMAFEPIKLQLKRDLKKWERYIGKQIENGKLGGRPKKAKETQKTQAFSEKPKKADTVLETDTVTDINTLREIEIGATIEFCVYSIQRQYDSESIIRLWKAFLINGQKENYAGREKKIQHFRNWIKTQPHENGTHKQSIGRINGAKGNKTVGRTIEFDKP